MLIHVILEAFDVIPNRGGPLACTLTPIDKCRVEEKGGGETDYE